MDDYRDVNRANWDERVAAHAASPDYAVSRFTEDPAFLSEVVTFDLPRLGDIAGLDAVHLQCHIGTDTVSLARLGATHDGARLLGPRARAGPRASPRPPASTIDFVESDLYGAPEALGRERFDLVYTGIGALCWLPDVRRWAEVVASLLRPGGRLFIREGHPVLWALAEPRAEAARASSTPTSSRPSRWSGTSAARTSRPSRCSRTTSTHEWNHGLGEIVTAVLAAGLELTALEEHDRVPWDALPGQMTDDRRRRVPAHRPPRAAAAHLHAAGAPRSR